MTSFNGFFTRSFDNQVCFSKLLKTKFLPCKLHLFFVLGFFFILQRGFGSGVSFIKFLMWKPIMSFYLFIVFFVMSCKTNICRDIPKFWSKMNTRMSFRKRQAFKQFVMVHFRGGLIIEEAASVNAKKVCLNTSIYIYVCILNIICVL